MTFDKSTLERYPEIKGVHPAAEIFPMMPPAELQKLADDIKENGQEYAVVIDKQGLLIDGRNRVAACDIAGVPVSLDEWDETLDPVTYVIQLNLLRRQLDIGQRAAVGVRIAKAREKGNKHSGAKGRAYDAVSGELGVSRASIQRAVDIMQYADLEEKLDAGGANVTALYKEAKDRREEEAKKATEAAGEAHNVEQAKQEEAVKVDPVGIADGKQGFIVTRTNPGYKPQFNKTNQMVDWAQWTWNPITGCHHGCEYCYARDLATNGPVASAYPTGFEPTFHPQRLAAPGNTALPKDAKQKDKNVFVCSMADLFGKWVPQEWITKTMDAMIANPQWTYLVLTKFPQRLKEINDLYDGFPNHIWVGTSVDNQARVRLAERCFRDIKASVKWLSCEPLLVPLQFEDLTGFNWVVIGGQSPQNGLPAFQPEMRWVVDIMDAAQRDGCKVFCKTENMPTLPRELAW